MEAVTNAEGKKGFYDKSTGFVSVDDMQKVTNNEGQKGYYHETSGFIPAPQEAVKEQTTVPQEKGFMDSNRANFDRRIEQSRKIKENPNLSATEKGMGYMGQGFGMVADIPTQAVSRAYKALPESVQEGISNAPIPFLGGQSVKQVGQSIAPIAQKAGQAYNKLEENAPRVTNVLDAAGNAVNLGGLMSGGVGNPKYAPFKVGESPTLVAAGKIAGKGAEMLEKAGIKKVSEIAPERVAKVLEGKGITEVSKDALDAVKPDFGKMSKKAQVDASSANLTQPKGSGIFKGSVMKTTSSDVEMAKVIEDVYDKKKLVSENVDKIYKKIGEKAEMTSALPEELGNKPINFNKLEDMFAKSKENSGLVFASDAAEEKAYDSVINEFKNIYSKKTDKLSSVLQARKELDAKAKEIFGDNFFSVEPKDKARHRAMLDIRNDLNEFAASELPEGNKFKALLHEQNLLYRASDRLAENAAAKGVIDKSKFMKLVGKIVEHPIMASGAAGALLSTGTHFGGGGALATIASSPLTYLGLVAYGSVKLAGKVWTAPMVRQGLIKFLKVTEKTLSTAEKNAVRNAINGLPAVITAKGSIDK